MYTNKSQYFIITLKSQTMVYTGKSSHEQPKNKNYNVNSTQVCVNHFSNT